MGLPADHQPEDAGVPDLFGLIGPIPDDAEIARMVEERLDFARDDEVEVEEQGRPLEVVDLRSEKTELVPPTGQAEVLVQQR